MLLLAQCQQYIIDNNSTILMKKQISMWEPPCYIFEAGFGCAKNTDYHNDASTYQTTPRRVLITQTCKGSGTLYAKGKRFEIKENDIFVIERPGPYVYCFESGNISPWEFNFISIAFSEHSEKKIMPDCIADNPIMSLKNFPFLKLKLKNLYDIFISVHKTKVLAHSVMAYDFLISYIEARMLGEEKNANIYNVAVKLKTLLDTNYTKNLKIQDLAAKLGYSKEALIRSFKSYYGVPPLKYLNRLKILKASKMLEKNDLSVKEIAYIIGFKDANYFCRLFRSTMGSTPTQYRKLCDTDNVELYYKTLKRTGG